MVRSRTREEGLLLTGYVAMIISTDGTERHEAAGKSNLSFSHFLLTRSFAYGQTHDSELTNFSKSLVE